MMSYTGFLSGVLLTFLIVAGLSCDSAQKPNPNEAFADLVVSAGEADVEFFWRDDQAKPLRSIQNLKTFVEKSGKTLRFAMNGGMYQADGKPLGLFIQNGKTVTPLNTRDAKGNFYIKPNGVFGVGGDNRPFITPTQDFKDDGRARLATQSGPMLLVDGEINPEFAQNSGNLNLRNGVCVLGDDRIVFAISRREVNFYDFAAHFKDLGCRNALYLDGAVSRMYLPEQNLRDLGGDFGVMIAVVE